MFAKKRIKTFRAPRARNSLKEQLYAENYNKCNSDAQDVVDTALTYSLSTILVPKWNVRFATSSQVDSNRMRALTFTGNCFVHIGSSGSVVCVAQWSSG